MKFSYIVLAWLGCGRGWREGTGALGGISEEVEEEEEDINMKRGGRERQLSSPFLRFGAFPGKLAFKFSTLKMAWQFQFLGRDASNCYIVVTMVSPNC